MKQKIMHEIARSSWKRGYMSHDDLLASYAKRVAGIPFPKVQRVRQYPEPLIRNFGQFLSTN